MKLSKSCIEEIEKEAKTKAHSQYAIPMSDFAKDCLTNPTIIKEANLYTQEEVDKIKEEEWWKGWHAYGESL
jgi:hypothetical protein